MYELDDITGAIVDSAVRIHKELGPGLLESVYEVVLARVLERRGFKVQRQKRSALSTTAYFLRMDSELTYWLKGRSLSSSSPSNASLQSTENNCLPIFA